MIKEKQKAYRMADQFSMLKRPAKLREGHPERFRGILQRKVLKIQSLFLFKIIFHEKSNTVIFFRS